MKRRYLYLDFHNLLIFPFILINATSRSTQVIQIVPQNGDNRNLDLSVLRPVCKTSRNSNSEDFFSYSLVLTKKQKQSQVAVKVR